MTAKSKKGASVKFIDKYGVKLATTYEGDPECICIPPPGHALHDPDGNTTFDEVRVQAIDKIGQCVRIITVWSDPDAGKLWCLAGRGNIHDVREVNRRRRERSDAPIPIGFTRFKGTLDDAVDFVAMENFRRKRPSPVHVAREIIRYAALGRSWARIAEILQLDGEDEKTLKRRAPIAYCIPEVVDAIERKEIPLKKARLFGGRKVDGSQALGRDEQLQLLAEVRKVRGSRGEKRTAPAPRASFPRAARARAAEWLANGHARNLPRDLLPFARAIAAYERYVGGDDDGALNYLLPIKAIVDQAKKE